MTNKKLDLFIPARSPSQRVKRVEKEIRRILAEIFLKEEIPPVFDKQKKLIPCPALLNITGVNISKDLKECTVFAIPLADRNSEKFEEYFSLASPVIRTIFAHKSVMKFVPNFNFIFDKSFVKAERIDELIKINSLRSRVIEDNETQNIDNVKK